MTLRLRFMFVAALAACTTPDHVSQDTSSAAIRISLNQGNLVLPRRIASESDLLRGLEPLTVEAPTGFAIRAVVFDDQNRNGNWEEGEQAVVFPATRRGDYYVIDDVRMTETQLTALGSRCLRFGIEAISGSGARNFNAQLVTH